MDVRGVFLKCFNQFKIFESVGSFESESLDSTIASIESESLSQLEESLIFWIISFAFFIESCVASAIKETSHPLFKRFLTKLKVASSIVTSLSSALIWSAIVMAISFTLFETFVNIGGISKMYPLVKTVIN